MVQARWNGRVLAESEETIVVEGNHYFPADAVDQRFLASSDHHTVCGWKGTASYHDVVVDGRRNANAAWYYPETSEKAAPIRGRIAFWKGVEVK